MIKIAKKSDNVLLNQVYGENCQYMGNKEGFKSAYKFCTS